MAHPSAERVIRILDFLGTHPGRGFILSDLAQRLAISRSTAHAVLVTLAESGMVVRHAETLEYRLGPALIPLGTVAERALPAVTHARHQAEQLAREHEAECIVLAEAGADLLVVGHAGMPGPDSFNRLDGQRFPFAPPIGALHVAWEAGDAVEAWLDRAGGALTDADREHYRAAIRITRRRGYGVGLHDGRLAELLAALAPRDATTEGRARLDDAQAALARDGHLMLAGAEPPPQARIMSINAPVFGPSESMILTLVLMPADRPAIREASRLARPVVRAARRVTDAIHGRLPRVVD